MKSIVIRKSRIILVSDIILLLCIILTLTLSLSAGVRLTMSGVYRNPVTSVEIEDNKLALSVNVYENTDVDSLLKAFGETRVTFFVSEAFQNLRGIKVTQIAEMGHDVGILEDNMRGKSRKEINDRLAARIERLSFLTGQNADLVRFNNNSFDTNCVDAVFSLGLYAVQYSTDDTAENYSSGDIILVTGESNIEDFIQKITADGFSITTVDELILRRNYIIDSGGMQSEK